VEERQYEEYREFDMLQEESENIEDLTAEMSALECTYDGCTAGEGGTKFMTPALQGCITFQIRPGFRVERYPRLSEKMWKPIQRPQKINLYFWK
jgi:hypothetical protein